MKRVKALETWRTDILMAIYFISYVVSEYTVQVKKYITLSETIRKGLAIMLSNGRNKCKTLAY